MKRLTVVVLVATIMLAEALMFMIVSQPTRASEPWWDTNWTYRRPITIGPHPENYQIKVIIPDNIPKSDYPSIRFLEDSDNRLLPYWIERNENSYLNVAWIRRQDNFGGYSYYTGGDIWMYYGNPSATSAENGDNVFLFFDDFGGNALNTSKWGSTGNVSVSSTVLHLWNDGGEGKVEHGESQGLSTEEENTRRIIEFRMKNSINQRGGLILTGPSYSKETACIFTKGSGPPQENRFWSAGCPGNQDGGYLSENNRPGDKWYILRTDLYGENKDQLKVYFSWGEDNADYRQVLEVTKDGFTSDWAAPSPYVDKYNLRAWDDSSSYYFDWFFVRRYADPEPSVTVGDVQTLNFTLHLLTGWNLVGFQVTNENMTPNNLFAGTTFTMYYWDAPLGPYNEPSKTSPVEDNRGYWVKVNENKTVTFSGIRQLSRTMYFAAGWNLVNFPKTSANTTPNNLFAGTTFTMYYWDAPLGPYNEPSKTSPVEDNRGYWVKENQNYAVTIPL